MRIIIVDDENLILEGETNLIRRCVPKADVQAFNDPEAALEAVRSSPADVAFLDLEMPSCHGTVLARQLKALYPQINIIFATAYRDFYEKALELRVSGYLLKPLQEEQVMEELRNLRYPIASKGGLFVRAFGSFEVFFDGKPVSFRYQKTKELFAYLIDRRGALITQDEIVTVLWGGDEKHSSYFKQLQKDLSDTLGALGCGELLIKQRGALALWGDQIRCDYYDWIHGLPGGLNAYRGEYMRQYDWGEATRVNLEGGAGLWDN